MTMLILCKAHEFNYLARTIFLQYVIHKYFRLKACRTV